MAELSIHSSQQEQESFHKELKQKLEIIIEECYIKAEKDKFKNLNFVFPNKEQSKKFFQSKLQILSNLDVYSKTFLEIHTRAKLALREFQSNMFKKDYLELLRSVLTLSDNIGRKKSVSIKEKENKLNHEFYTNYEIGNDITVNPEKIEVESESEEKPHLHKKVKYLKAEITGNEISKYKRKLKSALERCSDIEL